MRRGVIEEIEHDLLVIAEEREAPEFRQWRLEKVFDDTGTVRAAINVVSQRYEPFLTGNGLSIGDDLALELDQLSKAAMHVADRIDSGWPAIPGNPVAAHGPVAPRAAQVLAVGQGGAMGRSCMTRRRLYTSEAAQDSGGRLLRAGLVAAVRHGQRREPPGLGFEQGHPR